MAAAPLLFAALLTLSGAPTLTVEFVGNAGVRLTDGDTTLLVDLPYTSGAYGYMTYDPERLDPVGDVVCVITHRHADHFSPSLFAERSWRILGPDEVTRAIDSDRVVPRRPLVTIGPFEIEPIRTPHANTEHYSYTIRWRGRTLHVVGDTESPDALLAAGDLDLLFVTPWLSCIADDAGVSSPKRAVLVHHRPWRPDPVCGGATPLDQDERLELNALTRE